MGHKPVQVIRLAAEPQTAPSTEPCTGVSFPDSRAKINSKGKERVLSQYIMGFETTLLTAFSIREPHSRRKSRSLLCLFDPHFPLWDFKHADTHMPEHIDAHRYASDPPLTLVRVVVAQISRVLIATRQVRALAL